MRVHTPTAFLFMAFILFGLFLPLVLCAILNVSHTVSDESLESAAVHRDHHLCNIDRIDADTFTTERFLRDYYQTRPFILTGYLANSPRFRALAHVDALIQRFGRERITAASANTYSHIRMEMSFRQYVDLIRAGPITLKNESDATAYFFGDHDDPGQWDSDADLSSASAFDDWEQARMESCTSHDDQESTDANCIAGDADRPSAPANHSRRPIWAKLLRHYHPPTYVVPKRNGETNTPAVAAASITLEDAIQAVDEIDSHSPGVRRVKLAASTFDAHRQLFESGVGSPSTSGRSSSSSSGVDVDADSALPPRFDYSRYSFGLGGDRSGVPFHFHGAAIGEVLHGRKRWFLYPPNSNPHGIGESSTLPFPHFRPDLTQLQWMVDVYPHLAPHELPLQCTLAPEELIYVPGNWYHATINLGEISVFISSFIDEGRMEKAFRDSGIDIDTIRGHRHN